VNEKLKVLIVEDATLVALHLKITLQARGYQVVGSMAYAEKAVEYVDQDKPDLILMDVMLKGEMDGIEAAQLILKKHKLPILFLTALSDEDTLHRINDDHLGTILNKPFQEPDLHEKLASLMG
jgi:CheY-like chemotaxis protein